MTGDDEGE